MIDSGLIPRLDEAKDYIKSTLIFTASLLDVQH